MADIEGRLARPVRSRARWRRQALLVTPLLNKGEVIGAIVLRQSHLKPFTERQIQAIEVFADQAVIAITDRLREPGRGSSAA
jgi:GAF domain-containing protein